MSYTIPISYTSLGLHTQRSASKYLGVSERQLAKWLKKGKAPAKYLDVFVDLGTAAIMPMDEPPSQKVIGRTAALAFEALLRGETEIAEAMSAKGVRTGDIDWSTGKKAEADSLLGDEFNRYINAYAWSRNQHRATLMCGLPALYKLHLDVCGDLLNVPSKSKERNSWEFLHAQTFGSALGYLTGRLGLDWFARPAAKPYAQNREHRRRAAQKLLAHIDKVDWETVGATRGKVTTRVAFNLAQIAALARNPADDDKGDVLSTTVFMRCLVALHFRHAARFEAVLDLFVDDDDTGPMLKIKAVADLISHLKSGKANH